AMLDLELSHEQDSRRNCGRMLSAMKTGRIRSVKRICWFSLIGLCVFHGWSDARNITLMRELQRHGQSLASAREQIHWLCGPLNVGTLVALAAIVILSIKWNGAHNKVN